MHVGYLTEGGDDVSVSPDGRQIIGSVEEVKSGAWLMELLIPQSSCMRTCDESHVGYSLAGESSNGCRGG